MKNYRKIWESHFGPIPKDKQGRSYEIHHINGNHNDNRLENLICVTIEEHFYIHLSQKDYAAAFRIGQRMNIPPEEKSKLMSLSNKKRLDEGEHSFQNKEVRKKAQKTIQKRINEKRQGFQNKEVMDKAITAKKEKYSTNELSDQVKKGWEKWKSNNGDAKKRTLQGSKAGAQKTRGSKWYHMPSGEHLRTYPEDPRIQKEGWIKGRFNGKELSKNANFHKLNKNR